MRHLPIAPVLMLRGLLLPGLLLLSACGPSPEPDVLARVVPADALCRPTPNGRDATGCYVTLTASRDDRLVSVSSPMAARAEVHEMKIENGIMSMGELKTGLPLLAGEAVALRPGGNHIMLLGLRQPLKTGETLPLMLNFERAGSVAVQARVAQPGIPQEAASQEAVSHPDMDGGGMHH